MTMTDFKQMKKLVPSEEKEVDENMKNKQYLQQKLELPRVLPSKVIILNHCIYVVSKEIPIS